LQTKSWGDPQPFHKTKSIMAKFKRLITPFEASQAGRNLAARDSSNLIKSNAGYVLACWRWQEFAG